MPFRFNSFALSHFIAVSLVVFSLLSAFSSSTLAQTVAKRWVETESTKRVALVIGNGDYQNGSKLKNPTNDADAIAKVLKSLDFDVLLVKDGTHRQMLDAIDAFGNKLSEDCVALCYYSGHGVQIDGINYLLPVDFRGKSRADAEDEAIAARRILGRFEEKKSPVNIVILDACRNNPFRSFSRSGESGLTKMDAPRGTLIAYATAPGSVADDNSEGENGLYTTALLKELPRAGVKVQDMFQQVLEDVATASNEKQTPWMESSLRGTLFMVKDSTPVAETVVTKKINLKARLRVTVNVPDATVLVDGKATEDGAYVAILENSETKTVQVKTSATGYVPDVEEVRLIRGKVVPLAVTLEKEAPSEPAPPPVAGKTKINPKDGAAMVFIPAGPFLMGDSDPDDIAFIKNNNPRHTVMLSGFWIYKNPVTVGEYKRYVAAMRSAGKDVEMPRAPDFNPNWSKEDHPIVNVSWEDAKAYCDWAGVRLPTEAQWEKAARGTAGKKYPWGDDFDTNKLWHSKGNPGNAGGTTAVGHYGISPYGVTDMAGNVWQWCSDWFDATFWTSHQAEETDPENQSVGDQKYRILRGGSWGTGGSDGFRSAYRGGAAPGDRDSGTGFRGASGP